MHWIARLLFLGIALAVRLPLVLHLGPSEGGGDEWYDAWRAWAVLFEQGNPGNFLRPALFYEAGAAVYAGLYVIGRWSGRFASMTDLLGDFVLDEARYIQALQVLAAVFGAATVPVVYEIGRRIGGTLAGVLAASLLTLLPLHVEYSQRARVDALCVLLSTVAMLAFHRLAERGRRRDFISSGVVIGLAVAANYPAALLGIPYLGAAWLARDHGPRAKWAQWLVTGGVVALATFVLTNPYVVLAPQAAWNGFLFQLAFSGRLHPFTQDAPWWFYLALLRDQSLGFATLAVCASVWLTVRSRGFGRILGSFPWLFIVAFMGARTQFDRYVLVAMPWICVGIGVCLVEMASRHRWVVAVVVLAFGLTGVELWRRSTPLVLIDRPADNQRWEMQRWLIDHTPPGATVWIESDVFPLLQATFCDPGGELQTRVREAFERVHPQFRARLLKGEIVERVANFEATLVTRKEIDLAVSCDRNVRWAENAGPERAGQRAFYAALAEHGTRRFEAMGCWVVEIR